ncbi:Bug family tripartite tricarboxylate transporter substrate binding protein [Comamonas koreensis]|uniref:Tripartite tricarboxylate transporter substrate binding protein n=1 Tax=Comamonas koreensis TaxID=160825 RepID=A0AAW4Y365_9BURK|nr:tripartite tricarboxylate transporter substrate binding protein [Comamonas koreensis]MCD2167773.1 tripartite tricarboxylate transporter substrate binding protein [Comamonas koreensis]
MFNPRFGRRRALALCAALLAGAASPALQAQDFPSKPIKFIVPFGPGSGTDTSARYYAKKLQQLSGQPVVVENRPGGNGFIAVKQALSAPADGYTVFIGSNSTLAVNTALFKALPYDPQKDFAPLTMMMRAPAIVVAPGDADTKQLKDLVAKAQSNPGKINFGAGSAGYQLMGELFNDVAKVQTVHVPFKGAGEVATAVAGHTVDYAFAEATSVQELIKAGRLTGLAVASDSRVAALPNVPTAREAGLPGIEAYTWVGAMVSSKTPADTSAKLAAWFMQIAAEPETQQFYANLGATAMSGGPAQMRQFQADEIALWKRIATQAKMELQ